MSSILLKLAFSPAPLSLQPWHLINIEVAMSQMPSVRIPPVSRANRKSHCCASTCWEKPDTDPCTRAAATWRNGDKSSRWRVGRKHPEFLQQSFATRPTPATVLRPAYFPFIFATDIRNAPSPMFTGPSAMMRNLPVMRQ